MNDLNAIRQSFLSVVSEQSRARAEQALNVIFEGVQAGSILNVDFKDAKYTLDRAADGAWALLIRRPFFNAGLWEQRTQAERDFDCVLGLGISYVRDAISVSKKAAKKNVPDTAFTKAVRDLAAAILPLAQAMEDLKAKVVKGRRPATAEVLAERARKAALVDSMPRATCGCCFGNQAVLPNGLVHDHGYRIERGYWKGGSCDGRSFRPLEVSDEGPKHMVKVLTGIEESLLADIANLRKATKFSVQHGYEMKTHAQKYEDIEVGHPEFERTREYRISVQESNLKACRSDLAEFKKVVAEWKPAALPEAK